MTYLFYVYECFVYMYICTPEEGGHPVSRNYSLRQLFTTMELLETELGTSEEQPVL